MEGDGGRTWARTKDPLIKSQLLYQLSYASTPSSGDLVLAVGSGPLASESGLVSIQFSPDCNFSRFSARNRGMTAGLLLSALAMTLIVAVRYLAVSGGFAWATARLHPGLHAGRGPQMRREIGWSLASAAIYGVPAGVLAWGWAQRGWTLVYTDLQAWPLWWWPVS